MTRITATTIQIILTIVQHDNDGVDFDVDSMIDVTTGGAAIDIELSMISPWRIWVFPTALMEPAITRRSIWIRSMIWLIAILFMLQAVSFVGGSGEWCWPNSDWHWWCCDRWVTVLKGSAYASGNSGPGSVSGTTLADADGLANVEAFSQNIVMGANIQANEINMNSCWW